MPLELLRELSQASLPLTLTDIGEIDKLRLLRAAEYVAVLLSPPNSPEPFARVLHITKEGREALASVPSWNLHQWSPEPSGRLLLV